MTIPFGADMMAEVVDACFADVVCSAIRMRGLGSRLLKAYPAVAWKAWTRRVAATGAYGNCLANRA